MLTQEMVSSAAATDRAYELNDGHGLNLHVATSGRKTWRYEYRYLGDEYIIVLGTLGELSLMQARSKRNFARRLLASGGDPREWHEAGIQRRREADRHTFETVFHEWYNLNRISWGKRYAKNIIADMNRDFMPDLGRRKIYDISERQLCELLWKVEDRITSFSAYRVALRLSHVFDYAQGIGATDRNPAKYLRNILKPRARNKSRSSLRNVKKLRAMISDIERARSTLNPKLVSRLLILTCQRLAPVVSMEWSELRGIDWSMEDMTKSEGLWVIPAEKAKQEMRLRRDASFEQSVALSSQSLELLRCVRNQNIASIYVFPQRCNLDRPISISTVAHLYRNAGYIGIHTPHGWRTSFSTIMNELLERELGHDQRLMIDRMVVDLILGHRPKGLTAAELIYNRASFMPRRREIANMWADLIFEGAMPLEELIAVGGIKFGEV